MRSAGNQRVAVLLDGFVRQEGPVEEVFSRPACDEVARLVGVETVLAGKVASARPSMAGCDSPRLPPSAP